MHKRVIDLLVGLFLVLGMIGLLCLAIQVSGLTIKSGSHYYTVTANFDEIGSLKIRQPVRVAGVSIGSVAKIGLNDSSYMAKVYMLIDKRYQLPVDTQASIMTDGILGSKYISLTPGYQEEMVKPGGELSETHSAFILEDAIGKFLFNADVDKDDDKDKDKSASNSTRSKENNNEEKDKEK